MAKPRASPLMAEENDASHPVGGASSSLSSNDDGPPPKRMSEVGVHTSLYKLETGERGCVCLKLGMTLAWECH